MQPEDLEELAAKLRQVRQPSLPPDQADKWLRWIAARKNKLVTPRSEHSEMEIRWAASADVRLESLPDGGCQLVVSVLNVDGGMASTVVVVNLRHSAKTIRDGLTVVQSETGDFEGR